METLFRDMVSSAGAKPPAARVDEAALHWRLSLALNSPLFTALALSTGHHGALTLRQAEITRFGALKTATALVTTVDNTGRIARGVAGRASANVFADGAALAAAASSNNAAQPPPAGWPPPPSRLRDDDGGAVATDLLPGCVRWRDQADGMARLTARRIAAESCAILCGDGDSADEEARRRTAATLAYGVLRVRLRQAVAAFTRLLAPDVLAALAGHAEIRLDHYHYYAAPGDPTMRRRRLQALAAYPLLMTAIAEDDELGQAVDSGAELNAALRRRFGCSRAALRALRGVGPDTVGSTPPAAPLLTALSACPPAWRPRAAADWRAFRSLLDIPAIASPASWTLARIREFGPDWAASAAALGPRQRLEDLEDYRRALLTHLILAPFEAAIPGWTLETAWPKTLRIMAAAMATLIDDSPLVKQLAASDAWHRRQDELSAALGDDDGGDGLHWTALSDPFAARNGLSITPLTSSAALRREGADLGHCVGAAGYDALCAFEGRHIVGIRRADGARLATAELRVEGDGPPEALQTRGALNAEPDAAALDALSDYLDGLASDRIAWDRERLAADQAARRRRRRAGPLKTGFDAGDRARLEAVWAFYRTILPRRWRHATFDDFQRASGLFTAMAAEWSERRHPPVGDAEDVHRRNVAHWRDPCLQATWARLTGAKAGEEEALSLDAARRRRLGWRRPHQPPLGIDEPMEDILAAIRGIIQEE